MGQKSAAKWAENSLAKKPNKVVYQVFNYLSLRPRLHEKQKIQVFFKKNGHFFQKTHSFFFRKHTVLSKVAFFSENKQFFSKVAFFFSVSKASKAEKSMDTCYFFKKVRAFSNILCFYKKMCVYLKKCVFLSLVQTRPKARQSLIKYCCIVILLLFHVLIKLLCNLQFFN